MATWTRGRSVKPNIRAGGCITEYIYTNTDGLEGEIVDAIAPLKIITDFRGANGAVTADPRWTDYVSGTGTSVAAADGRYPLALTTGANASDRIAGIDFNNVRPIPVQDADGKATEFRFQAKVRITANEIVGGNIFIGLMGDRFTLASQVIESVDVFCGFRIGAAAVASAEDYSIFLTSDDTVTDLTVDTGLDATEDTAVEYLFDILQMPNMDLEFRINGLRYGSTSRFRFDDALSATERFLQPAIFGGAQTTEGDTFDTLIEVQKVVILGLNDD